MGTKLFVSPEDNRQADIAVETPLELDLALANQVKFGSTKASRGTIERCTRVNRRLIERLEEEIKARRKLVRKSRQAGDPQLQELRSELATQQRLLANHQRDLALIIKGCMVATNELISGIMKKIRARLRVLSRDDRATDMQLLKLQSDLAEQNRLLEEHQKQLDILG